MFSDRSCAFDVLFREQVDGLLQASRQAENDFDGMDEIDRARMLVFERRALETWQHNFYMNQEGLFPDYKWEQQKWLVRNFGRRQSARAAWKAFGAGYGVEFQSFMEQQFAIADSESA